MSALRATLVLLTISALSTPAGCGGDEEGPPVERGLERTGQPCNAASECFQGIAEGGAIRGEAVCLDRVEGGYCTHLCTVDTDCCAVPGECKTTLPQVCSPFESTGQMMCFLSCEEDDIRAHDADVARFETSGNLDTAAFCTTRAGVGFGCRSSGGGGDNRKVCVP